MTTTLATTPTGQNVRLVGIQAEEKLARRLRALGMTPGVELAILQNTGSALVLAVRGSRIALGQPIAHDLLVERL
ncbi:MAG: FeoA domain-containing protein [Anaerolineae bacterium]|nr:FeoA domain-containing protein [Anaerolineae bacterium]